MKKYTTSNPTYRGYSINTNNGNAECYTEILDRYLDTLEYMTDKHSKVLQTRFDIRIPKDGSFSPTTEQLSRYNEYLKRNLECNHPLPEEGKLRSSGRTNNKNKVDPHIIRVSEQNANNEHSHLHYLVFVNGNAKNSGYDIQKRAEHELSNAWNLNKEQVKGLIDYCNKTPDKNNPNKKLPSSYMLDRNASDFHETVNQATHQASYLAKTRGKDNKEKGLWTISKTRLPKEK